jgi:hypothetical protein
MGIRSKLTAALTGLLGLAWPVYAQAHGRTDAWTHRGSAAGACRGTLRS